MMSGVDDLNEAVDRLESSNKRFAEGISKLKARHARAAPVDAPSAQDPHADFVESSGIWLKKASLLTSRPFMRARAIFGWLEVFFPKRVVSEEIGDALEMISRLESEPVCPHRHIKINFKIATTVCWVIVNSVRLITSSILGKKAD